MRRLFLMSALTALLLGLAVPASANMDRVLDGRNTGKPLDLKRVAIFHERLGQDQSYVSVFFAAYGGITAAKLGNRNYLGAQFDTDSNGTVDYWAVVYAHDGKIRAQVLRENGRKDVPVGKAHVEHNNGIVGVAVRMSQIGSPSGTIRWNTFSRYRDRWDYAPNHGMLRHKI